jgi:hypothetical protein
MDPLRDYADLYHRAVECRRRVDAIKSILSRALEGLDKRPERFRFDGIDGIRMPRPPAEAFAAAADWPSAAQIQQALADWQDTADGLLDAWERLWPRDRELLARASPDTANIPRAPGYAAR